MLESGQVIKIAYSIPGIGAIEDVFVESSVGEGQHGTIWKVRDKERKGQYFALEYLNNEASSASELRDQLQKQIAEQLKSSWLPKAYCVVDLPDGSLAVFGEYVEGTSLSQWLADNQTRPWASKKDVFIKIMQGVRAIQQKETRFILNPSHIVVSAEGDPRLVGHGLLACPAIEPAFSVSHQPPEHYLNPDSGTNSAMRGNVFVLGCLLYSFIKGDAYWNLQGYEQPPFDAMTENGVLKDSNILDTFDQELEYPAEVVSGIRIATQFKPEQRFNNTDSFLRHFKQEAIPEVQNIAIEPTFKAEKVAPPAATAVAPAPQEEMISRSSPKKYRLKKGGIIAGLLLLMISALAGGYFLTGGTSQTDEPIEEASTDADRVPQKKSKLFSKKEDIPLEEAKEWEMVKSKKTEYYLRKYMANHPTGTYADDAYNMLDSIRSAPITENHFLKKRFTGKYSQSGDTKVFSMVFVEMLPNDEMLDFECSINMGSVRKKLKGSVDTETFVINFEELGDDYPRLNIMNGRVYNRDNKIYIESTDIDQYWNLRD